MRMTSKRIHIILALLAITLFSFALPFDYPTKMVDGKLVYVYPVKKSEGLYRISVTFGVTQEELLQLNPELRTSGLKFGQSIYVPVKEDVQAPEAKAEPEVKAQQEVKEEPKAPEAKQLPPKQELLSAPSKQELQSAPAKDSKPARPARRAKEVKELQEVQTVQAVQAEQEVVEEVQAVQEVLSDSLIGLATDTLRLAILLPLQADAQVYDVKMERFLKFYEGALLALRQERREEWKYEVYVYDVGKTEYKLRKVLEQPAMQHIHAIIGPAYTEQIPVISAFAKNHRTPCLLPFTNNVDSLDSNPYLLQYNPVVPEGMKAIQFKKEVDGSWSRFDELMDTYFNVRTPSQARPRYDLLGYDLTRYFIPAVLRAMQAETDEEWQTAFETVHDGLQSTLQFQRVEEGGFMNTPLRLVRKITTIEEDK